MNKTVKKVISLVLVSLLTLSLCVPSFAALEMNNYPTIHIHGRSSLVYDKDGKQIYTNPDPSFSEVDYAKSLVPFMAQELSKTFVTQDWEGYSRAVCDKITPLFEMIQLDENGNAKDGTNGGEWKPGTALGVQRDYTFNWDWRTDVIATARNLGKYIEEVKRVTGADKVNIDSRCLGSVIVTGYLHLGELGEFSPEDDVANLVFYVPTILGSQTVGALFANQIEFDAKAIDDFVTYYMNGPDRFFNDTEYGDELEVFIATFCSLMYQLNMLGFGTDVVSDIYDQVKDYMVPRLATHVFFFPTYWAMIDDRYYETAKEQLFTENSDGYYTVDKDEYAGYIEKIDYYHYNVQNRFYDIVEKAKAGGMNISVIAKYGSNLLPVEKDCLAQGDGRIETTALSFGAYCSDINKTLTDEYIESHDSKYISKDKKIDASTCLFPDNTWFIRDIGHGSFPNGIEQFKEKLLRSVEQPTVDNMNEEYGYSQFMSYSASTDSISEVTEPSMFDDLFVKDFFIIIFRFLTALFRLLAKVGTVQA